MEGLHPNTHVPIPSRDVLAQSRNWSRAGLLQSRGQMSSRPIPAINELIAWLPRHCAVGKFGIEVQADSENGCDYDPNK